MLEYVLCVTPVAAFRILFTLRNTVSSNSVQIRLKWYCHKSMKTLWACTCAFPQTAITLVVSVCNQMLCLVALLFAGKKTNYSSLRRFVFFCTIFHHIFVLRIRNSACKNKYIFCLQASLLDFCCFKPKTFIFCWFLITY